MRRAEVRQRALLGERDAGSRDQPDEGGGSENSGLVGKLHGAKLLFPDYDIPRAVKLNTLIN